MFKRLVVRCVLFLLALLIADCVIENQAASQDQSSIWGRKKGDDWPTFLGPTGDGKSTETGILKDWSDGKLKLIWKIKTGEGYGMGSVVDGRFYHFGRIDGKAKLLCLNAETGDRIWDFAYDSNYRDMYGYDNGPRASPIIDDGLVYIYGVEGMLHCLDATTGELVWKRDMLNGFGVIQNFFGVASTPVIYEDQLIVMVGGSPDGNKVVRPKQLGQVKPNGSGIVSLNKKTGEVAYKSVNDLASYVSLKMATINDQVLLLAWMRGSLFGVEPKTGKVSFEFPWRARMLESVNASTPIVVDDQILISECYQLGSALIELEDDSPVVVWSDKGKRGKAMEAHWNTPIAVGDFTFGCSGRHSGQADFRCIETNTGDIKWKQGGLSRSSSMLIDGHLIVMGEQGELVLIKANSDKYEEVTRYAPGETGVKFKYPCWAAPIVSHGLLFVRGKEQLACFELISE